jgi:hypothetical protein
VDPIPDTLLLRKSGSAGNRTQTSGSVARYVLTIADRGTIQVCVCSIR